MELEETLEKVGPWGRYQTFLYSLFAFGTILEALYAMDTVFMLGLPKFRCAVPDYANDTYEIQGDAHIALINASIPEGESCYVYGSASQNGSLTKQSCSQWVYDTTFYSPSVISEFDIVCDKVILRSVTNMLFMFFKILGGIGGGHISDRFGRKKVFCISLIMMGLTKVASGFAPEIYSLMILRGISSCFSVAFYQTGFVWAMEFIGSSKRQVAGMICNHFFGLGVCLVTPFAYFIRNWRHMTFAVSSPCVVFLGYWWLMPESPRWLLSKGRREEAEKVVRKAAKVNKKSHVLPAHALFEGDQEKDAGGEASESVNCCAIMKNKTLAIRLLCLSINWAAVSAAYYGLSLNSGNLSGDIYINYLVTGLIELPAYTFALFAPMKFGRKYTHAFAVMVGGLACVATIFPVMFGGPSLFWVITTLSTIGKFGASASFASVYIWTAEMTPTSMRVVVLGISSAAARLASMVAPYITDLGMLIDGPFSKALPLMILGAFCLLAGILSLKLPETLGRPLPETLEDALRLGKASNKDNAEANQTELEHLAGKQTNGTVKA